MVSFNYMSLILLCNIILICMAEIVLIYSDKTGRIELLTCATSWMNLKTQAK